METEIIKIGNSRGIRIPKAVLEQCRFNGTIKMKIEDGNLILSPITKAKRKPREGWEDDAKLCHEAGDDKLIWPDGMINEFDKTEWTWPVKEN